MRYSLLFTLLLLFSFSADSVVAEGNEDCFDCHDDVEMTMDKDGEEISLHVTPEKFATSVHGENDCISCHADLEGVELPHDEGLKSPVCDDCHDDVAEIYNGSLHGRAVKAGAPLAPRCWDCHDKHEIHAIGSPESQVDKFNVPFVCGRCHKEGTEVTQTYDIPQEDILAHYSLSIHGQGLFKQGLTVTAVCSDCHTAHNVLPHTDPNSSINHARVSETCRQCHGQIERVHQKVIKGELWEKEPNKIPVCVDCHAPHEVRRVFYETGMSDRECLKCHSDPELSVRRNGKRVSLFSDPEVLHDSVHRQQSCVKCHTDANPDHDRPCDTIPSKVDCAMCHAEPVKEHTAGIHGQLEDRGDQTAPSCGDCHGDHGILDRKNPESPTYPTHIPELCGECHREGGKAAKRYNGTEHNIIENYTMSIHGKGLLESGLLVTAMCTDCHEVHEVLPHDDPNSSIHRENVAKTCAKCHAGIHERFEESIHSPKINKTDKPLPVCNDCHSSHTIARTDESNFMLSITNQCGKCHADITETYFDTFHGKVSKLGYTGVAKCFDCHGSHDILPTDHKDSKLHRDNIVATCEECHPGSHRQFAGYLTHATHHDKEKYPILYYTFWFMTFLLVGTFIFFGVHTLLWLPRSFLAMRESKKMKEASNGMAVQRFKGRQRVLHIMVIVSFLGLALTGMTLKFSYLGWAVWLTRLLGGFESAGFIHRICAVITFSYFALHIYDVFKLRRNSGKSWFGFLMDPNSMVPNLTDLKEFIGTVKWFLGMGPRPNYGRWTYWEKFDYFAVFWGVAVIGMTGMMLWFPETFTLFLPGWFINVATIIHSDEALLATGFIFTIHFFNTHFRPDRFPMDTVIFTGQIPLEEFKHERPREYEEAVKSGKLEGMMVSPMAPPMVRVAKIFGTIALVTGLTMVILIIYAEVFGYR